MTVTSEFQDSGALVVKIDGRFDSTVHKVIMKAMKQAEKPIQVFKIDLEHTRAIDSSGIGALLALRDELGKNIEITIINASKDIQKTFVMTKLDELFPISGR